MVAERKLSSNKPNIKVVVYDKIRGYLNWFQEWFVEFASENCNSTTCILSENKDDVSYIELSSLVP